MASSHNEYHGYVKLPKKKLYEQSIRLDFNGRINSQPNGTKLEGFSLRMFAINKKSNTEWPEIGITLRPEEWLDLIDAMKEEFELAQRLRKDFEE